MTHSRDQHQLVYHYADGVADILGLSTAQQLALRTAMHLALREQAAGYEATQAELSEKIHALTQELTTMWQEEPVARLRRELAEKMAAEDEAAKATSKLAVLLTNVKTSETATISTNGTHPVEHRRPVASEPPVISPAIAFDAEAAQESAAQQDPTPAPSTALDRKPYKFTWQTLDDQTLQIVQALDAGRQDWRSLQREDKRVIVMAAITELQLDMPPGQTLGLVEFDRRRPIWMSGWSSLTQTLGRTWTQILDAVTRV